MIWIYDSQENNFFWQHHDQGLLLALRSGVTSGGAWKTLWDVGDKP